MANQSIASTQILASSHHKTIEITATAISADPELTNRPIINIKVARAGNEATDREILAFVVWSVHQFCVDRGYIVQPTPLQAEEWNKLLVAGVRF